MYNIDRHNCLASFCDNVDKDEYPCFKEIAVAGGRYTTCVSYKASSTRILECPQSFIPCCATCVGQSTTKVMSTSISTHKTETGVFESKSSSGALAGGILGSILALCFIILLCARYRRRRGPEVRAEAQRFNAYANGNSIAVFYTLKLP